MQKETPQLQRGFTLIELLVVIAIISLLATVILGSIRDADSRAQNTAKVELSRQYINALELYYTENNAYPNYTTPTKCLGAGISNCQGGGLLPSAALNAELTPYISGPPPDQYKVTWGASDMTGITYVCFDGNDSDGVCTEYFLRWYLEGTNQECGPTSDALDFPFFGTPTLTKCEYYSDN